MQCFFAKHELCICALAPRCVYARVFVRQPYLCWSRSPPVGFCKALCSSCPIGYTLPETGRHLRANLHHTRTPHSHSSHGLKGKHNVPYAVNHFENHVHDQYFCLVCVIHLKFRYIRVFHCHTLCWFLRQWHCQTCSVFKGPMQAVWRHYFSSFWWSQWAIWKTGGKTWCKWGLLTSYYKCGSHCI